MIRQLHSMQHRIQAENTHLRSTIQSLFEFAEHQVPTQFDDFDLNQITYINHRKVVDLCQSASSIIHSEIVNIDPITLKNTLHVTHLSLEYLGLQINRIDSQLEKLQTFYQKYPSWRRLIWRSKIQTAYKKSMKLKEKMQELEIKKKTTNHEYLLLQKNIRQVALAIVKTEIPEKEKQHLQDIEALEASFQILQSLLRETEHQKSTHRTHKVAYYEVDRIRILSALQQSNLVLNQLLFQLNKVNLDTSILTREVYDVLLFEEKKGMKWHSDRFLFQQLLQREMTLQIFLEGFNRVLQPESHRLNMYADRIAEFHFLTPYSLEKNDTDTKPLEERVPPHPKPRSTPEVELEKNDEAMELFSEEVLVNPPKKHQPTQAPSTKTKVEPIAFTEIEIQDLFVSTKDTTSTRKKRTNENRPRHTVALSMESLENENTAL